MKPNRRPFLRFLLLFINGKSIGTPGRKTRQGQNGGLDIGPYLYGNGHGLHCCKSS